MNLTQFLLRETESDEAVARAATDGPWVGITLSPDRGEVHVTAAAGRSDDVSWALATSDEHGDALHIARHDPTRVLADCAARRAIVELHSRNTGYQWPDKDADYCSTCGVPEEYPESWPCSTLRHLAQPYRDRPDYDPAWDVS